MTEPRSVPSQEPGHRYHPRTAVSRVLSDVHRQVQATPRPTAVLQHGVHQLSIVPRAAGLHHAAVSHHTPAAATAQHAPKAKVAAPVLPPAAVAKPMQVMAPDIAARFQKSAQPAAAPSVPPTAAKSRTVSSTKPAAPRLHRSLVLHRRIADKAAQHQKHVKQQRIKTVYAFGLGGLAALVFMAGVLVITGKVIRQNGAATVTTQTASAAQTLGAHTDQASAISVDETEISSDELDGYDTAADKPRIVLVPRLKVQSRIVPVAAGYNGEPLQTKSLYDFGWLSDTALPGSMGVTVVSGYTAGPTKLGPLTQISDLKVGDDITIERGDGKTYVYKVIRSQVYEANKVDMSAVRSPAIAGKPGLNILTYTGRFNIRANQFEPRTVIFASMQ